MKYLALIAALALAACGSQKELRPAQGQSLPPAAYGAEAPRTADQLIQPDAQARPARSDEVLTESQDRAADRFDLPPQ
jgi:uncharacterized lipoprotein YmbA